MNKIKEAYSLLIKEKDLNKKALLEKAISNNAFYSFLYAKIYLKDRFILGEESISKSPKYSCLYSEHVIKGRWKKGEKVIATDIDAAFDYFFLMNKLSVLNYYKRMPKLEKIIFTDAKKAFVYVRNTKKIIKTAEDIIKSDFNILINYLYKFKDDLNLKEFEDIISNDAFASLEYCKISNQRFEKGEKEIKKNALISVEYYFSLSLEDRLHFDIKNILLKHQDAEAAYNYSIRKNIRFKKAENFIAKNPLIAYYYSKLILNSRFKLAEEVIFNDVKSSILYLIQFKTLFTEDELKLIKDKLETLISQDAESSFSYAKEVLKSRFPLGEKAISENPYLSYNYALNVINDRFVLGEKAISSSPRLSTNYAIHILKDRFFIAEKTIATNGFCAVDYCFNILKQRFLEAEKAIFKLFNKNYLLKYLNIARIRNTKFENYLNKLKSRKVRNMCKIYNFKSIRFDHE